MQLVATVPAAAPADADGAIGAPPSDEEEALRTTVEQLADEARRQQEREDALRREADRLRQLHADTADELRGAQLRIDEHAAELDRLTQRHDEQLATAYAHVKEQAAAAHAKEEELSHRLSAARTEADDARAAKDRLAASHESTQQLLNEKLRVEAARAAEFERRYHDAIARELEVVKEREARQREHDEERLKLRMSFSEREAKYIQTNSALETEARLLRKRAADADEQAELRRLLKKWGKGMTGENGAEID